MIFKFLFNNLFFFLEKEESGESAETGGSGGSTLELSFNLGGSVGFGKYALKDP